MTTTEELSLEYLSQFKQGVEAFGTIPLRSLKEVYKSASPGWLDGYDVAVKLYDKGVADAEQMAREAQGDDYDADE